MTDEKAIELFPSFKHSYKSNRLYFPFMVLY